SAHARDDLDLWRRAEAVHVRVGGPGCGILIRVLRQQGHAESRRRPVDRHRGDSAAARASVLAAHRPGEVDVKRLRLAPAVLALALITLQHIAPAAVSLSPLRGIQEVKAWFNAYTGRPRLILLLSPT